MKLRVLGQTVYIEPILKESAKIGIIIPGQEEQSKETGYGRVVYAGDECIKLKVGDVVIIPKFGFEPVAFEGHDYRLGNENNIHTVIDEYDN